MTKIATYSAGVIAANSTVVECNTGTVLYSRFVANKIKDMGSVTLDTLHAAVGISGEAGELLDAVKKHWAYGKPLDVKNVREELGDLMFYITAMMLVQNIALAEILQENADKLDKRYPAGYTDKAAGERADKIVHLEPGPNPCFSS